MTVDPRTLVAQSPMSRLQLTTVSLCILLLALDGFDVLAISFAAPGIADEWGVNRAALGVVLSMELIGMSFGSIFMGALADRFGRRPVTLACLSLMAAGMYAASTAGGVGVLSAYRFATGLGIGGILASATALTAEFTNLKRRNFCVILMAAGYPVGVIAGGSVAAMLLSLYDWRAVFMFGAVVTLAFIPLTWFLLPESIASLVQRRPPNALERVNETLFRMGHAAVDRLPAALPGKSSVSTRALFTGGMARTTVVLTIAYFAHIMTFYFTLKWIPKIVVDMGYPASQAGGVLVWANVGGLAGCLLLGLMTQKYSVRALVIAALVLGAAMVAWFGQEQPGMAQLSFVAAAAGFFTNAAVVGMYALFAQCYPTEVRAGGTGFVIGAGRGGSAVGPILAGLLFAAGAGLPTVAALMGMGSLLAALALLLLRPATPDF